MHDGDDTFGDPGPTRPDPDEGAAGTPPAEPAGAARPEPPSRPDPLPTWSPPAPASATPPGPAAAPPPPAAWEPAPGAAPAPPLPGAWAPAPPTAVTPPPASPSDPTSWSIPATPPVAPLPIGPSSDQPAHGGWAPPSTPGAPAADWGPPNGPNPPPPAPGWSEPRDGQLPPGPAGWAAPLPTYAGSPPPPPGAPVTKGRSRAALAILSVVAVLAASTFAVVALTRPDGAGSPEEAVESLFAAIGEEDAIGVMESLPPGEREVLLDPLVATVGELQRLGLLDSFALEDVPGADITVDGLTLQATNLGPGVTKVRITGGTITGTVIPDEVPIGPRTRDLAERTGGEPIDIPAESDTESLADADLELVTIEEDGGWHVSLFYTIAESARGDDTPLPQFGSDIIPAVGSDTPEGAVRGLVEAGLALDLGRAVGHLPPDEMRVLYDYIPLFLDDANKAADEVRGEGYQASLDRLDLHSEGDDENRRVMIDGVAVSGSVDEGSMSYSWDGSCTVMEVTGRSYERFAPIEPGGSIGDPEPSGTTTTRIETCTDGRITVTEDGEVLDEEGFYGPFGGGSMGSGPFGPMTPFGADADLGQAITVVEVDGRWYVSPVRTVFDSMLGALRGLDGADIDKFFDDMDSFLGGSAERFEEIEGTIGGTTPGTTPYDSNDPYIVCSKLWLDDLDPSADDDVWDEAYEQFDQCLVDMGEEPFEDDRTLGEPRFAGGHVLVPAGDAIEGYDLEGALAWQGPECEYAEWASVIPSSVAVPVEVARCDDELVAIDGADGTELWRRPSDLGADHTRVGPTTFMESTADDVVVYDVRTGAELWRVANEGANRSSNDDLIVGSLVVSDDRYVYRGDDDDVTAHDITTGEVVWTRAGDTTGLGVDEGILITRDRDRVVRRLDPSTGEVLWASEADNEHLRSADVVAFTEDTVILQSTFEPMSYVAYDLATGTQLWVHSVTALGGPIRAGARTVLVQGVSGTPIGIDPRTGATLDPPAGLPSFVSGVAIDGDLLAAVGYSDATGEMKLTISHLP